ncbi:MAG: hypothetical protein ACI8ZN_001457 [Bacteroidia bacterium]|jgi:hypothetical protein
MDSFLAFLIGCASGIGFCFLDNKFGRTWYQRWHNLTNQYKIDPQSVKTFVQYQPFSKRFVPAILLGLLLGYIFYLTGAENKLILLLDVGLMMVGILLSFYVYPIITKKLPKQLKAVKETLEKFDGIEEKISKAVDGAKAVIEPVLRPKLDEATLDTEAEKEPPAKKKDDDWRSGVKDFLDK